MHTGSNNREGHLGHEHGKGNHDHSHPGHSHDEPNASHKHGHHHHFHHETEGGIKTAFFLNLLFAIIEIVGGILTNSVAIVSDAIHDLGDATAIGIAWFMEKMSLKSSNKKYTYGYGRLSILSALMTSVILLVGSVIIIIEAVPRLIVPEEVNSIGMFGFAIAGVVINGAAVLRLKKGSTTSLNKKAITLHLMEDVLGWVAVLAGSVVIYFTEWYIIDPLLSLLIAAYILFNVVKMVGYVSRVLLQGTPDDLVTEAIHKSLLSIAGVSDTHDLHIWTLDNEYHILSVHLVVSDDTVIEDIERIKKEARGALDSFNIKHATIEIETGKENCLHEDCIN